MRIRIHPALYVYLVSMLALSSWQNCVGAMISLFVHEAGHWCISYLFHERIDRLELTPFGGVMFYEQDKSPSKGIQGICVAAAGPIANYLLLANISLLAEWMDGGLLHAIVSTGMTMILINLLPALPLDGGRIVFCIGYYVFPLVVLVRVLCSMGIVVGCGFLCLAVYGLIAQRILNCSVLIVGGYLIYWAQKSREQVFLENLYTLIQETDEEILQIKRVNVYRVSSDIPILRLIPLLGKTGTCEFVASLNGKEQRISSQRLCRALLDQPFATVQDVFFQKNTG